MSRRERFVEALNPVPTFSTGTYPFKSVKTQMRVVWLAITHHAKFKAVLGAILISICLFLSTFVDIPSSNLRLTEEIVPHKCVPHQDSPTLVSLHTKLRIYYDGGQWFHMAENFLVQHAILSQKDELLQAKHVYYNFDQSTYLQLNHPSHHPQNVNVSHNVFSCMMSSFCSGLPV